jgi:glyoxylase-like metal-dependent hydrolase (beta-lactamase superfamily II)/rhodanese-related sulfurtransferase
MFVQQFFVPGLAHSSYLLGGTNVCAIVDPARDIDRYIEAAAAMGMQISHVLQTHLHADFVSGHLDLADRTGATVCAPKSARCAFDHTPLADGDTVEIEDLLIEVIETPGHTPEHVSYVVRDHARGRQPVAVFCGDTLFVGDVGRPDLFPGKADKLASALYDSLHGKLLKLPDFCEVLPAHGAGSLCGRAMGAKRTSTIGYEKKSNAALRIRSREAFVRSLTTNMPAAPDHFSRCSAINGRGPALVRKLPVPQALGAEDFHKRARRKNAVVVDLRGLEGFGGLHVPASWNIDVDGNFATFAGWVLPADGDILLVADTPQQVRKATTHLRRVGHDRVVGHLAGGVYRWARAAFPTDTVRQLSVHELHAMVTADQPFTLVDVRAASEFDVHHIRGAVNVPAPELRTRHQELDTSRPVVCICNTGPRASLGSSILKQAGFAEVRNVAGGMTAYAAAGHAPQCPICMNPHGPAFLGS